MVYLLLLFVDWLSICGIVKLITLCFDVTFSWAIATGVWLILFLLNRGR